MFFWFVGLTFVGVALVFASPAIDYRLVMIGSVLPTVELIFGGPWPLHTLLAPVVAMCLTMVVFTGKRLKQRRWLGLTIGLFSHLVLDGTWSNKELFWWPAFGTSLERQPGLPSLGLVVIMELVGLAALAWGAWRFEVNTPEGRDLLLRTGRLSRSSMTPITGTT